MALPRHAQASGAEVLNSRPDTVWSWASHFSEPVSFSGKQSLHLRTTVRIRQEPPPSRAHSLSSRPRPTSRQPTFPEAMGRTELPDPPAGAPRPLPFHLRGPGRPSVAVGALLQLPKAHGQQVHARSSSRTRRKEAWAREALSGVRISGGASNSVTSVCPGAAPGPPPPTAVFLPEGRKGEPRRVTPKQQRIQSDDSQLSTSVHRRGDGGPGERGLRATRDLGPGGPRRQAFGTRREVEPENPLPRQGEPVRVHRPP